MQRISIIVPLMGDLKQFEDTLVSVLENRPDRSEVVVVHNRPYDDPYELRGEVSFVEARHQATLLECFANGLAASRAAVVHLIAAGFEATPGWADAALERFNQRDIAAVAPLVVDRNQRERILSAGLRYTPGGSIRHIAAGIGLERFAADEQLLCGPELCAAFYRRDALAAVESLPNDGSDAASSVELGLALRCAGYRCVQQQDCLLTASEDLFKTDGRWREGIARERLFRRWSVAGDWKRSRLSHAGHVAMEALQIPIRPALIGHLAGRAWAAIGFGASAEVALGTAEHNSVIRPAHFNAPGSRAA